MLFHNETYDLRATKGYILVLDIENEFIKTGESDIVMPQGTAYEEANEGSGALVTMAQFSRLGVITDVGLETEDNLAIKEGLEIGTMVYYVAQAASHIPIGPSTTAIRIPVTAVLGVVTPVN